LVKVVASHILDAEPGKPAEQQVGIDPLDQLRTDRIKRLQQQRAH
jgi:hypothetical protein